MPDNELEKNEIRESIAALTQVMLQLPDEVKVPMETMHLHVPGMYCRTVLMKAGTLVVGKIHKKEHIVVVSQGSARVISEEFGSREICAPSIFISPPGVQRTLFILSDMLWTTVHSTNETDIGKLEDELIAKDYSEVQPEVKPDVRFSMQGPGTDGVFTDKYVEPEKLKE